ncbi:hypothetical protein ACFSSA_09380 [Luteolibacter algae]|uniref:Uncharacterized protein n=1 Tax=Luteolibacter algae TaxID=454151 RepID=A0ABW5D7P5_9BACT
MPSQPGDMRVQKIETKLKLALGMSLLEITEIPAMKENAGQANRGSYIINVGPLSFGSTDPKDILRKSVDIANKIVNFLASSKECAHSQFGLSIFSEPGDQSSRVYTGTIDLNETGVGIDNIQKSRMPDLTIDPSTNY